MFRFSKFIIGCLLGLLATLGEPFKYKVESNLRHVSEAEIRKDFKAKRAAHYGEKFGISLFSIVVFLAISVIVIFSKGWALGIVVAIIILVDVLMIIGRATYLFIQQEELKENGSTALVSIDDAKDSTLASILEKRKADVDNFVKSYEERTGRKPNDQELRSIYT